MPKLLSVRVVNAQFNEGKGLYQDFRMPFHGRNATYELGNGMGKSVLLMLILQCVLPNTTLDTNKPFKYMFAGGDRNRTTHVLAEWELDEGVAEKKYLLTGFCAKRKSDQEDESGSDEIKYFSYLHLYDEPNDLDINKIPLCREEGSDFFTQDYSEIRKMLREGANAGYDIWIANTRRDYLERLKRYYLIESEWELIKLVNRQENYLKTHFHNFRDSRAFVEDLLIKMIERCLKDRQRLRFHDGMEESGGKTLADALYQSQEDLRRLQEEQARLHEYERLHSEITTLQAANEHLLRSHQVYEDAKQQAASQYAAYRAAIVQKGGENRTLQDRVYGKQVAYDAVGLDIEKTKLMILNVNLNLSRQKLEEAEAERRRHERAADLVEHRASFARAVNKYLLIREREADIRQREEIIRKMDEDHQVVFDRIRPLGKTLYTLVGVEKEQFSEALRIGLGKARATNAEIMRLQQDLGGIKSRTGEIGRRIVELEQHAAELEAQEKNLAKRHERCPKVSSGFFLPDQIDATTRRLAAERETCSKIVGEIHEIELRLTGNEALETGLKKEIVTRDQAIGEITQQITEFTTEKDSALQIASAYEMDEAGPCAKHLKTEAGRLHGVLAGHRSRREGMIRDLESAEKYGFALSREYLGALDKLQEKYPTAMSGAEHLKSIPEDEQRESLKNAPWLPKAVLLLGGDFEAIVRNPTTLPAQVQDAAIVITSIDHLRERRPLSLGDIYITSRSPEQSLTVLSSDRAAEQLRKEITAIEEEIQLTEEVLEAITRDSDTLQKFIARYPVGFGEERETALKEHIQQKNEGAAGLVALQKQIKEDRSALPRARGDLVGQKEKIGLFEKKLTLLTELSRVAEEREEIRSTLQQELQNSEEAAAAQRQIEAEIKRYEIELKAQEEANNQAKERLRKAEEEISEYEQYAGEDVEILPGMDINHLREEYRAARKVVDEVAKDRNTYEKENARDRKQIQEYLNDISHYRVAIKEIEDEDPQERYSPEYIRELDRDVDDAKRLLGEAASRCREIWDEHHLLSLDMERAEKEFSVRVQEAYIRDPDLADSKPLEADLKRLDAESHTLEVEIAQLGSTYQKGEKEFKSLVEERNGYEMLDSTHHFIGKDADLAPDLLGYRHFQEKLAAAVKRTSKQKDRFSNANEQFLRSADGIDVPHYFIDAVREKIRIAESAGEAASIQRSLEEYAFNVTRTIGMVRAQVEGLLKVEREVVDQALGMAMRYRDYLKMIPGVSKIEINGRFYKMLEINFDDCIYPDEVARGEMHRHIQDLTAHIQAGTLTREDLEKALAPGQLVGRVVDMDRIRVRIRKIDIDAYPLQLWDRIRASEGQENTMYIILLVVLMSTIRAIVIGRPDQNTAKVLFVDNPFGSTGSHYLWEKIWSILERNNVQMICSGHKIDAKIREFFPISYLLTDELSTGGRMRIGIKFIGAGKELDRLERQKRGEILAWAED